MSSIQPAVSEALKFTYSDYRLLRDYNKRYEILDGKLLPAIPTTAAHQIVLLNLAIRVHTYIEKNNLGQILIIPIEVVLSNYDVVQPDIIFISSNNKQIIKSTHIEGIPDLVVEIISPGSAQRDRIIKRKIYALHGVKEYWLVHPEKQRVQMLRLEKGELQRITELTGEDILTSTMLSGLEIQLTDIFPKG